jgi:hypothetical protein
MFVPEELVKVEVSFVHYLVENKIALVLSSTSTPVPFTVPPAKENQKGNISFHHALPNK